MLCKKYFFLSILLFSLFLVLPSSGSAAVATGNCTDTDPAADWVYTKGTCTDKNSTAFTDYCDGYNIVDYYCSGGDFVGECKTATSACGGGCKDGACIRLTEDKISCSDKTDNDGDGAVDCYDSDCNYDTNCNCAAMFCGPNTVCKYGGCACGSGYYDCNNNPVDGCESKDSTCPSPTPTTTATQPPICPAVCVPMWKLSGSTCEYNKCGSGCGPDGITTFNTEVGCKSKIPVTTPVPTTTATPIPVTCSKQYPWSCKTEDECVKNELKWCKYQWGDVKCEISCLETIPCPAVMPPICGPGEELVQKFDGTNRCSTGFYCKPKDTCTTEWKPVCGEDGRTYSSPCRAYATGVPIRHEGECGSKVICDDKIFEEKVRKCREDNGDPQKYSRPDGCVDIFCKYPTIRPIAPLPIPTDCVEEKDPTTGFVRYKCIAKPMPPSCPIARSEDKRYAKDKCYAHGGTPEYKIAANGCEYLDCNFERKRGTFETAECHSDEQIREVENKCSSLGLKTVYKATKIEVEGKICKSARCIESIRTEECPTALPAESKIICPQGAMETVGIDERGCNILKCVTKEERDCPQSPPKEAFLKCEERGGRMIVKQDDKGCTRFAECVSGKEEDLYVERVEKVPDTIEVLQFALKLEGMKITLDKFTKTIDKIANYYKTKSQTDHEKYKRIKALLSTAGDTLEKVKEEMRRKIDTLRTDDIEMFKYRIKEIKQIFKKILFILLGGKEAEKELTEKVDCGQSSDCMENAFKVCRPAKMSQPGGGGPISEVAITGLEGEKCVLKWTGGTESMTCRFENYTLGTRSIGGPEGIEKYCEGSLVKYLSKMTTQTKMTRTVQEGGRTQEPVNNAAVDAVKLSANPSDTRYKFTGHDPDGIREFYIEKKNFDNTYVKIDPPCTKTVAEELNFDSTNPPTKATILDCGTRLQEIPLNIAIPGQPIPAGEVGQAQKPPPIINGVKVSSDPNDLRYKFTAHVPGGGIREFTIVTSGLGRMPVKAEPPCSREFAFELKLNPSDFPVGAEIDDCGDPAKKTVIKKVNIGIPEQPEAVVMPTLQPVQQVLVGTPTQTI